MVHWTAHGSPLAVKDFSWAKASANAGHVIERDRKFFWYTPVWLGNGRRFSIGVAVSENPTGPFKDAIGVPLTTSEMTSNPTNSNGVVVTWDDIDPVGRRRMGRLVPSPSKPDAPRNSADASGGLRRWAASHGKRSGSCHTINLRPFCLPAGGEPDLQLAKPPVVDMDLIMKKELAVSVVTSLLLNSGCSILSKQSPHQSIRSDETAYTRDISSDVYRTREPRPTSADTTLLNLFPAPPSRHPEANITVIRAP